MDEEICENIDCECYENGYCYYYGKPVVEVTECDETFDE